MKQSFIKVRYIYLMDSVCVLSWNIRGLSRSNNRSNLKDFIIKWKPSVVCLQETIISNSGSNQMKDLKNGEKSHWLFQVPTGYSGGLVMTWKEEVLGFNFIFKD